MRPIDDATTTRRRVLQSAGLAGVAGLSGCTGLMGGGNENASLEVSGWAADDTESEQLGQLIEQFDENHEDISVDYSAIQSNYKQRLRTQLGAQEAPDVFYVDVGYFGSFASEGALLELGQYIEEDDEFSTDDFFEPLLDGFRYDGGLYGIPKDFNTLGFFHNTEMLETAGVDGVPETWSELTSALEAIDQNVDVGAPMIEFANGRIFWALMWQNGGQVLSDDGSECVVASDQNVEALEYLVGLKQDGLVATPSELGVDWHGQAIGLEEVAVAAIGGWAIPPMQSNEDWANDAIDVATIPYPSGGEQATAAYTVSYSASKGTDRPEDAYELISTLTGDEGMAQWMEAGIGLSARKSHADNEFLQENPRYKTLFESAEHSHVVAFGPQSEAIKQEIQNQLEGAMLEEKSPREALEAAQEKINSDVL